MQKNIGKILFSLAVGCCFLVFLSSCKIARHLPEGQSLLVKNKFVVKDKALSVSEREKVRNDFAAIVAQKPNRKFLGLFPFRMWLYASATKGKKLTRFKQWIIDKVGEQPVVLDTFLTSKSVNLYENYMFNFGFFHAEISDTTVTKRKKSIVTYKLNSGPVWKIGTVTFNTGPFKSDSMVYRTRQSSFLKTGARFDIANLKLERDRIESLLRNTGFYFFSREYVRFELDTLAAPQTVSITVNIIQPSDTSQHEQYRLNNFYITTDIASEILNDTLRRDTIRGGDSSEYYIISQKKVLKRRIVAESFFMKRGQLYSRNNELNTINRLSLLGVFKFITVDFTKAKTRPGNYLDCIVSLSPAKRQSLSGTLEANVTNEGLFGLAASGAYKNKNLSKRADQFMIDAGAGLQLKFSKKEKVQVITSNINASVTYYLNRFLFPFRLPNFTKNTAPKTRLSIGYNFEHRFDFDTLGNVVFLYQLHNFNASFGYEWTQHVTMLHSLNPLTINFFLLPKTGREFNRRLDSIPILKSSYEEQIIIGPNYTFVYNNQQTQKDRRYMYFRVNLETAGNIIEAGFKLANLKSKHDSIYYILHKPFSQYFRVEGDWRNYFRLRNHGLFAVRATAGIGVPYGNSIALPFIKQFFVGGPNSLRGFLIREIGPGSYVDSTAYNPETGVKQNIGFFNQTGDIKLEMNAEFRFDIYKWLKGAFFLDAGNVWTLRRDSRQNGNFEWNRFWKEFAVDAGLGIRLDFNFFVIRFDYGFPLRDPRKTDGNRWLFQNAQFRNGQFQLAIGYPF